jgi:transposase
VIHPSSVAVSREHRRAKTDRLDTELLKRGFLGWLRGVRRSRVFGQVPGRNKLKAGSRLVVSPFPEIKFILSCCGVL